MPNRKTFTLEYRKEISERNKKLGIKPPSRVGAIPWNKGKSWDKKTKQKMSLAHLGKGVIWSEERKLKYRGENSANWRGGTTRLAILIRCSQPARLWSKSILTRDDFTCQECGLKGVYLEAHHIKQFSEILSEYKITSLEEALKCKELWDLSNGIALCRKCHDKTKTRMYKKTYATFI